MNSFHSDSFREARNTAAHSSNGARALTSAIPPRWRAAVLLTGTIVFFPVFIVVIMLDAVTHDMPRFRIFVNRTGHFFSSGMQKAIRFSRVWQADWRLPDFSRSQTSLPS